LKPARTNSGYTGFRELSILPSGAELKQVLTCRWLAIALAANLMLWLSMLYTVFVIDMYSEHRAYFIATTWIIFVIPFFILGGLVFTPYPRVWRHKVVEASKKRPCKTSNQSDYVSLILC
jgi:hypothetical protein